MTPATNHTQAGDPAKLAAVILRLTEIDNPPVSFVAGSDAVEWAISAIRERQAQVDTWRDLSVSLDAHRREALTLAAWARSSTSNELAGSGASPTKGPQRGCPKAFPLSMTPSLQPLLSHAIRTGRR